MEVAVVPAEAEVPVKKMAGEGKGKAAPEITEVAPSPREKNRIHVATNKKNVGFYVRLARRIMRRHNEVVLSALGKAIGTVVEIAVILKTAGLATEKHILTSTIELKDETNGRNIKKAKIEILLGKKEKPDDQKDNAVKAGDGVEEHNHTNL